ncbi:MAG: hypothetical protein Q7T82_20235, partial [Armatimonadota bacterium]|nr:hypothetical protein [Armatimonadota bacterium]
EFFYAYLDLYGGTTQQAFLIYSTGTDQVGDVGQPLPIPLEVLAQDASSAPVSGVAVGFAISSGPAGALLSVSSTATLGNGKASAVFTLGSIPLEYEVRATCSSCTAASNTVLFRACGKLPNDDFEQFDPRWSATTYDNTTQTMGAEGCAVSALAALNNFYRNTVSTAIPALDPDTLNRSLIGLGGRGYQPVGRLNWTGLTRLSGNTINFIELRDVDTASTIQDLISATDGDLARGRPVVIRVQRRRDNGTFGPHFVLAVGKCRGEYIIADPGSGTRVQFDPNDTNFELTGIRRFAPAL